MGLKCAINKTKYAIEKRAGLWENLTKGSDEGFFKSHDQCRMCLLFRVTRLRGRAKPARGSGACPSARHAVGEGLPRYREGLCGGEMRRIMRVGTCLLAWLSGGLAVTSVTAAEGASDSLGCGRSPR